MNASARRRALYVVLFAGALAALTFAMRDLLLRQATLSRSVPAAKLLLALGADPNATGGQGPPLHHAVRNDDAALIELLLRHGADVDGGDLRGHPALLIACARGDRRMVTLLLDRGADVNGARPDYSPLRIAAGNNRVDVVRDLLARGARPSRGDGRIVSDLQVAAASGAAEVLPLLISAGIPVDTKNQFGETPLFFAARRDPRAVRALLEAGAGVNVTSNQGATPLMEAVEDCGAESVRLLVAAGADPRVRNARGESLPERAKKCGNRAEILPMFSAPPR